MKNLLFSFMLFVMVTVTVAVRQHMGPTDVVRAVDRNARNGLSMASGRRHPWCVTERGRSTMVQIPGHRAVFQARWARSWALYN